MNKLDPDYDLNDDYDQTLAGSVENREYEDYDEPVEKKKKKKKFKMMCFSCNREEYHSIKSKRRWAHSYMLGLTFGLSVFIGPFSCSCCGHSRLMCRNWLSLRYWFRKRRTKLASSKR